MLQKEYMLQKSLCFIVYVYMCIYVWRSKCCW